jgi:hypothetical protein
MSAKPHGEDPKVVVITRGGVVIGEYRMTSGKIAEEPGVRKVAEKT